LDGKAGDDILVGGAGNDTLIGGADADTFVFDAALNPATNIDMIIDFAPGADHIALSQVIFTGLAAGTLDPAAFQDDPANLDADDRIIYDPSDGALVFDSDGTGASPHVQFATLQPGLTLSNGDFLIG
jgi:serralysin